MAEMELEESKDAEDDADFTIDKGRYPSSYSGRPLIVVDEEDIFDADFESTDEEGPDEEVAAEAAAQEEEKCARKACVPPSSDALTYLEMCVAGKSLSAGKGY